WLSPVNFYSKQKDTLNARLEATGLWILRSPKFESWLNGSKRVLFCPGIPGSGKTVLASIVIEHIQMLSDEAPSVGLAWAYCDYKQRKVQTLQNLLGSLIEQLVHTSAARGQPQAWKAVENLWRNSYQNTAASIKELSKLLADQVRSFRRAYIILDALDECDQENLTRDDLLEILQALPPNVHLFLTSRDIPSIESSIENALRLEIWAREEDVDKYVADRIKRDRYLGKHCQADAALEQKIKHTLKNSSGGMFLLARLHMDLLERKAKRSRWAVNEAITELPKTLDQTYGDALLRIRTQHPEDVELALRALQWVYFAREPLSLKDFQYAMVIVAGDTDIQQDRVDEPEYVISACAGLIQLDREAQVVRPVHETAQAYFDGKPQEASAAHSDIAATCLTYLLSTTRAWSYLSEQPFARYASTYAIMHTQRAGEAKPWDLLLRLCLEDVQQTPAEIRNVAFGPKLTAFLLVQSEEAFNIGRIGNMGPLQFAAYYGLNEMLSKLLNAGIGANMSDYNRHTPLHVAVWAGNEEAVRILLDSGASVNASSEIETREFYPNYYRSTPLSEAWHRKHSSIYDLLLSRGGS
ncbi:ankyrin, partial [Lophium mytilinum]